MAYYMLSEDQKDAATIRSNAAQRKREQREREDAAIAKLGGGRVQFLAYGGTMAKLEAICAQQGFTGKQRKGEALTFLIENFEL